MNMKYSVRQGSTKGSGRTKHKTLLTNQLFETGKDVPFLLISTMFPQSGKVQEVLEEFVSSLPDKYTFDIEEPTVADMNRMFEAINNNIVVTGQTFEHNNDFFDRVTDSDVLRKAELILLQNDAPKLRFEETVWLLRKIETFKSELDSLFVVLSGNNVSVRRYVSPFTSLFGEHVVSLFSGDVKKFAVLVEDYVRSLHASLNGEEYVVSNGTKSMLNVMKNIAGVDVSLDNESFHDVFNRLVETFDSWAKVIYLPYLNGEAFENVNMELLSNVDGHISLSELLNDDVPVTNKEDIVMLVRNSDIPMFDSERNRKAAETVLTNSGLSVTSVRFLLSAFDGDSTFNDFFAVKNALFNSYKWASCPVDVDTLLSSLAGKIDVSDLLEFIDLIDEKVSTNGKFWDEKGIELHDYVRNTPQNYNALRDSLDKLNYIKENSDTYGPFLKIGSEHLGDFLDNPYSYLGVPLNWTELYVDPEELLVTIGLDSE